MSELRRSHNTAWVASEIAAIGVLFLLSGAPAYGQRVVYIVRHAERLDNTDDSPLSDQGKARAKTLAALLKNAKIKGIYTSYYIRTKQTAEPLADQSHIMPDAIQNGDASATFNKIHSDHPHDAVLIVGHSDTVEKMLKKWVPHSELDIGNEYDNMIVVTPNGSNTGWVRLKYGAGASPP